jgi:hypothetical protein
MRRAAARWRTVLVSVGVIGAAVLAAAAYFPREPERLEKPIIAEIFAEPNRFSGRTIEVYGLVVQSDAKSEFLLQDVSQRPLRVMGKAAVGDQVTVIGKFHAASPAGFLAAEKLLATKVVGGGGCC